MTTADQMEISVTSNWGHVSFNVNSPTLEQFVQVAAAVSRWYMIDIGDFIITERDPKTGRFKGRNHDD